MATRRVFGMALAGLLALPLAACQQDPRSTVVAVPVQAVCDTSFRVSNQSSATVAQLYFSHSSQRGWGADQLGASVLPPGRFVSYRAANTGNYDFRVVWTNGQAAELRGVNVCRASQITVTNRGLVAS
ncbi:hypothetical protein [Falsiroseomonas oryziterrae]|uniref:hypothetical protein n=1 Tax=Falsiroseomonas oryziterrae TaxID=2911368 RepID=UPI001F45B7B7|nr:hypothetical protein [Roseomonas sp. NPKOSM-4]